MMGREDSDDSDYDEDGFVLGQFEEMEIADE